MRILIAGCSGLLGSNLLYFLENKHHILSYTVHEHIVNFRGEKVRIDPDKPFEALKNNSYDFIINAIAMTDVDGCEKNPELAYRVNTNIPEQLAKYCKQNGCFLIHISTDQIFDGTQYEYTEKSTPNPINVYGKSKLKAEQAIIKILNTTGYAILRTNFFGINGMNKQSFSEWIINTSQKEEELRMFTDVYFNPLLVNTFVEIIDTIMMYNLCGIYNCTSDERISKYEFGELLLSRFGLNKTITKISVDNLPLFAKRPKSMYLNNTKLKNILNTPFLSIQNEIEKLYNLYQKKYNLALKKHYADN